MNPFPTMNKHLLCLAALLVAGMFSPSATANDDRAFSPIRLTDRPYIERGMARELVREMFGAPCAQLSSDAWVYFDFRAMNALAIGTLSSAGAEKKDTLVVIFKEDRVSLIRACDSQPVRAFIAQQAQRKSPAPIIAKK